MASGRIESVLESLTYTKGVLGTVVCSTEGELIRDTFPSIDRSVASSYADMAVELVRQAALLFHPSRRRRGRPGTRDGVAGNGANEAAEEEGGEAAASPIAESELEMLRVRTRSGQEMIVRCEGDFILVIVQEPVE